MALHTTLQYSVWAASTLILALLLLCTAIYHRLLYYYCMLFTHMHKCSNNSADFNRKLKYYRRGETQNRNDQNCMCIVVAVGHLNKNYRSMWTTAIRIYNSLLLLLLHTSYDEEAAAPQYQSGLYRHLVANKHTHKHITQEEEDEPSLKRWATILQLLLLLLLLQGRESKVYLVFRLGCCTVVAW